MTKIHFKNRRCSCGITQKELAKATLLKLSTIRSWEQGRRKIPDYAAKIMRNLEDFLTWD